MTPDTTFTTSDELPSCTLSTTEPCVWNVWNDHDGRSPPGAEITMRNRVPTRKVCAMGSMGIRTRVNWPAGRFWRSEAR